MTQSTAMLWTALILSSVTGIVYVLSPDSTPATVAPVVTAPDLRPRLAAIESELVGVRTEVALCRRRTDNLRGVLEVLISSGIGWPERVALPTPAVGWEPWPELGGRDRPDEEVRR